MRVLITGAAGFVGSPTLTKLLNRDDVEYVVAIDPSSAPIDYTGDIWITTNLNEVNNIWWDTMVTTYNIDTILYLESIENSNICVPNNYETGVFQQADFFFVNFLQNRSVNNTILDVMYLSTDKVYYDDSFPNEIHAVTIQTEFDTPLPATFLPEDRQYFYSYAATKATTESRLKAALNINLRIIRPFAVTGPGRHHRCPLINQVQRAIDGQEILLYEAGSQGVAFSHVDDLASLINSMNLFDPGVRETLTTDIINSCRVQNYVSVAQLTDKIMNKTGSTSNIIQSSQLNTFSEVMQTPQIRNLVRVEIPQIPIEILLDEVITSLGYAVVYAPLVIDINAIVVDTTSIQFSGTAEPGGAMTTYFGNGENINNNIDNSGNFNIDYTFEYPIDIYPIEIKVTSEDNVQYASMIIQG